MPPQEPTEWREDDGYVRVPRVMRWLLLFGLMLTVACSGSPAEDGPSPPPLLLPPPSPPIESSFETDAEGWKMQGLDSDANDYSVDAQRNEPAVYGPTAGSPGGALERHESFFGYADSFQAPAQFLGDLSRYYGGTLRFDFCASELTDPFAAPLVLLQSGVDMWRYDGGPDAQTIWSTFTVPLAESGWTHIGDGSPATDAELKRSLGAVTGLWIRGEYSSTLDKSWLDNVVLGP